MKKQKGITLIALIITIIVLLILAGVSISAVIGENGIATKAKEASKKTEIARLEEALNLKLTDMQLSLYTDGNIDVSKIFEDDMEGLYRTKSVQLEDSNTYEIMINGIFENEGTLFRADFNAQTKSGQILSMKFDNICIVNSVDPMAEAFYKVISGNDEDITYISESSDITIIEYKGIEYLIGNMRLDKVETSFIQPKDLASLKWKKVFADETTIFALDTNDKLWALESETSGLCINNVCDEFNDFVVKDAIYYYNFEGEKEILGFIGTDGKMYAMNLNNSRVIKCLNDEFKELENIKAEEVIPIKESLGISLVGDSPFEYENCFSSVIRDTKGKIWVVSMDWNSGEFIPTVVCINNEIEDLNSITFEKMVVSGVYHSEINFLTAAGPKYFTILGLDSNNKLWKIQYTDEDIVPVDMEIKNYKFVAKNLNETDSFPLVKDIDYIGKYLNTAIFIDKDGILYNYLFSESEEVVEKLPFEIVVEEYSDGYFLDENGNAYDTYEIDFSLETLTPQYGNISKLFEHRIMLDNENNLLIGGESFSVDNSNFISVSTVRNLFVAVDDENNIIIRELTK